MTINSLVARCSRHTIVISTSSLLVTRERELLDLSRSNITANSELIRCMLIVGLEEFRLLAGWTFVVGGICSHGEGWSSIGPLFILFALLFLNHIIELLIILQKLRLLYLWADGERFAALTHWLGSRSNIILKDFHGLVSLIAVQEWATLLLLIEGSL